MSTTTTGRRPLLGSDDYHRIEHLARTGHTKTRTAAELGVSPEALTRWLTAHDCNHWFTPPVLWDLEEFAFFADTGVRLRDIAARLGYTEDSARRLLRRHDPDLLDRYGR